QAAVGVDGTHLHPRFPRLDDRILEQTVVGRVATLGHVIDHEAFLRVGDARLVAELGWLARVAAPDRPRVRINQGDAPLGNRPLPSNAQLGLREHLLGRDQLLLELRDQHRARPRPLRQRPPPGGPPPRPAPRRAPPAAPPPPPRAPARLPPGSAGQRSSPPSPRGESPPTPPPPACRPSAAGHAAASPRPAPAAAPVSRAA